MLQYPLQLPPLNLSSSRRPPLLPRGSSDDFRLHSATLSNKRAPNDKLVAAARPARPHVIPLSISSPFSSASSPSSSPPSPFSTSPKPIPRTPLTASPRQPSSPIPRSPRPLRTRLPSFDVPSSRCSSIASSNAAAADVLSPGDLVGEGVLLQDQLITRVPIRRDAVAPPLSDSDEPAQEFEVVRKLGTGSYAVVYLVREVLSRPPNSDDGHCAAVGRMDLDGVPSGSPTTEYGREYAIKMLSKANLDEDALAAQLFEATIHQSLPAHPNIVTLHRTLETRSFLLLLLEFVPGEDLYYFLEQARDHDESGPDELSGSPNSDSSCGTGAARTPPTPSLLAAQNLSRTRLRLVASMFAQMCDAVAVCHAHGVFHRDIKPENFIVTDGWAIRPDGRRERRVVVKLTDFGLSTTDVESADMDCGSAPYMSYECRNNLHPTYSPRAADVWSLGIVLINMLYHYNPWTDTTQGVCPSFEAFRQQPVAFFMQRFVGMTAPVAEFLATRVFCILPDPADGSPRVSAHDFGMWVRDLPAMLASPSGHGRSVSVYSVQGHPLASVPPSRRPSMRNNAIAESQRASRAMSRAPSLGPAYEEPLEPVLPPVLDERDAEVAAELDVDPTAESEANSRSASTHKRRKRGARKGKGSALASVSVPDDATLDTLAEASQALAREISRTSRTSQSVDPSPIPPVPAVSSAATAVAAASTITKKPSKWKLTFGKGSNTAVPKPAIVEEIPPSPLPETALPSGKSMSTTASNVTSLLMSLNAPAPQKAAASAPTAPSSSSASSLSVPPPSHLDHDESRNRGRHARASPYMQSGLNHSSTWGPPAGAALSTSSGMPPNGSEWRAPARGVSPASTRSGRPLASSANSMASGNWRSSMASSSASTSTSAFTRYSNNSARSVSTAATSVSSTSWRSQGSKYPYDSRPRNIPPNVKPMNGTPWELHELPRQMHQDPEKAEFGVPPVRKRRAPKAQDSPLSTISERPLPHSPVAQRQDAATSTTDLDHLGDDGAGPRKVQKGQINALAKMLSALRR
ncbi:kinase-like protein [Obba rivulosa]|uniref:Kinase-like protein n=1 Tax=Obba rivulosa TaxID=1052685 RepID=A0A8E2B5M1_9APHY|nr:kinase-like protein [Obba rivulosa]